MEKKIKITKLDGLKQTLSITINGSIYKSYYDIVTKDYKNKVKLDGFRSGKVPESVINNKYGANIHADTLNRLIEESFSEALLENKLINASPPKIVIKKKPTFDTALEFDAEFEIIPSFQIDNLDKISVEEVEVEITEKDIDEVILNIQKQHITWDESLDKAKTKDKVILDYNAKIDNKDIEDLKRDNFTFVIDDAVKGDESTTFLFNKFYEETKGKEKNSEFSFKFKLPDSFMNKDLAGKEVVFFAKVKNIYIGNLPKLEKSFYSKFGIQDASDIDFRDAVKDHMLDELEKRKKSDMYANINDQLLQCIDFPIPNYLLEKERQSIAEQYKSFMKEVDEDTKNELTSIASKRVKLNIIYMRIANDNNLQPTNKDVDKYISANYSKLDQLQSKNSKEKDRVFNEIKNKILEDGIMNLVMNKGKINKIKKNFLDVVK